MNNDNIKILYCKYGQLIISYNTGLNNTTEYLYPCYIKKIGPFIKFKKFLEHVKEEISLPRTISADIFNNRDVFVWLTPKEKIIKKYKKFIKNWR